MPKQFVLLILIVVTAIVSLALADASLSEYLSALIALAALVVSVVSAFKEDIFPFRPSAVFAELSFVPPPVPSASLALLVPIHFVNSGHGAGVIEGLTLKVEGADNTKAYTPVVEVDYGKFISRKRVLDAESMRGGFNAFPIGSRQSLQKHFLFTQ